MSEFDKVDVCVRCKLRKFCEEFPDELSCADVVNAAKIEGMISNDERNEGPIY